MIVKNVVSIFKMIFLVLLILFIILIFWINVLKNSFYISVDAKYYTCEKPYISAYNTKDGETLTTLEKKDYCVDLTIPFLNHKKVRNTLSNYKYLILDNEKLVKIKAGQKHTFFKDPTDKKYIVIQKDAGKFYLSYSQNWESLSNANKIEIKTVQPKLKIYDKNLSSVLFSK